MLIDRKECQCPRNIMPMVMILSLSTVKKHIHMLHEKKIMLKDFVI